MAASLGKHVISVSSLSKAYGVPGIRTGWLITRDPVLRETFLAAHEQINICGSVIDEWIAEQVMEKRAVILAGTLGEMQCLSQSLNQSADADLVDHLGKLT